MTPRDRPPVYWAPPTVTRSKKSRRGQPHLFRDDQQRSACSPHLIPDLRRGTQHRPLRTGSPPPNACRTCSRAWRAGWPHDLLPQETRTT